MAAGHSSADLLTLQGNIKRDPASYRDEFLLQHRHYQSLLELFRLQPSREAKEFGDLVMFMAQVSRCYPKHCAGLASELLALLDAHAAQLDAALRRTLVTALILMRNRGQVEPGVVLPKFFQLFRCHDKQLRSMVFKHIVADVRASNRRSRNERLNRALQNFLYGVVADDDEAAAKRSLAVLTELWRRHTWRDARTVNVIASAAFHKSSRVVLAAVKFFLGQDQQGEGGDGDDDDGDKAGDPDRGTATAPPSKQDIYNAANKGTRSSKKKKDRKIKRVMATVKKQQRRQAGGASASESFAAIHLLHDPQAFVERLFTRLQQSNSSGDKFETRLAILTLVSRVVGVHKLLLLNLYPFLQRYIAPHQREVADVLAALVQACHDLVPPDTLAPVLRQLVDQFVHDKARPEVMTIGLKTVRELCLRCPLVMTGELLQDLAAYKKFREKEVASAARSLIGLFRELAPELLAKKDRGRGADLGAKPRAYGETDTATRVEGADLLQAALQAGQDPEDDELRFDSDSDDDSDLGSGSEEIEAGSGSEDDGGEGEEASEEEEEEAEGSGDEDGKACKAKLKAHGKRTAKQTAKQSVPGSDDGDEVGEEDDDNSDGSGSGDNGSGDDEEEGDEEEGSSGSGSGSEDEGESEEEEEEEEEGGKVAKPKRQPQAGQAGSLADLKRRMAETKARREAKEQQQQQQQGGEEEGEDGAPPPGVLLEASRILTEEDFARIRRLQQRQLIEAALARHGLKSASAAKRKRLLGAAEEEAEEAAAAKEARRNAGDTRVRGDDLKGHHKRRKDKEERLVSVLAGREGREKFGASSGLKKSKTGGLSEREKQRRKNMPLAARVSQLKRRSATNAAKRRLTKNFKGRVKH